MNKIKICYTSLHCCIRVIKIMSALKKTGNYEIHGLANNVSYGTALFDTFSLYQLNEQFDKYIKDFGPFDLFIHANEPNWQVSRIREIQPDAKIILDGHDFDAIRNDCIPVDEHLAIKLCNGILFVSRETCEYMKLLYPEIEDKANAVLEHYCNEEFIVKSNFNRNGLVYEGGIKRPPYQHNRQKYLELHAIFQKIVNQGNEVHIMAGDIDLVEAYSNIGAYVYKPQRYPKMMQKLLTKKWGMVVFNNEKLTEKQVNLTRTNKEQEYIACGLPIIVCGAPATAEWVKTNDVGLVFEKVEDIKPEILEQNYERLKKNVDNIKFDLSMEKHIHIFEDMIKSLL